ncbi:autoinducer binding domain-containing protein [Pseudomonas sp. PCH199]|uniref:autoinducer binding domain-containing protein n=1 Tax=unclassified Pseudomonas TaxID=196821 RepID=UPI000BC97E51|nr:MULTISPECIES: autoinducer binding domain-containing protein [unclassified Pseudomonas]MCW8275857.1 autoinducer binding domain-containing protein [Pseudomonas sp. PCH199]PAM83932.1 LuxR family transcriptional regulator [Pseudomonas sp. ERMR1:02]
MERWKESQLKQISSTTELETAYQISLNFAKNIGFKFFAFSTTCPTKTEHFHTTRFNNYPTAWNTEYEKKIKSGTTDPVIAHCNQSMLPILWSEELFCNVPWIWEALEQQGLQYGWSQAVHDEHSGFCSILSLARSHCPVSGWELYENLGYSVFIGRHLHNLVVEKLPKEPAKSSMVHLSPREIDVLKLAATGKTAYESARILNLSARTVNFHVQETIRKFGVNNKVSAVIAAVKAGYLNSDAMR